MDYALFLAIVFGLAALALRGAAIGVLAVAGVVFYAWWNPWLLLLILGCALNSYLGQHPEVAMCPHKEPHFFSTNVLYARGLDWYRGLYAECGPAKAYGEASTSYSRAPEYAVAAERLHDAIPDARLVYLVREPVSRTQSDVLQALKYAEHALGRAAVSDSLDVLLERNRIAVHSSEYIVQIRHYLTLFDRSQLLVVLQDDLRDDPHRRVAR